MTTKTKVALLFLLNNTDHRRLVPFTAQFPQMKRLLQDPDRRFKVYAMCTAGDDRNLDGDFRKTVKKFIFRKWRTVYGEKSLAVAMADLLKEAVDDDDKEENSHFVFVSESCLPMWNPDVIYSAITERLRGYTWMSRWDPERCCERAGQQFITCRDHALIVLDRFDAVLNVYDDSTWAVDELVFLKTLRDASVPDVLHYAEGPTFVDWERPKGSHPHEFGTDAPVSKEDLFRLLASDALFCRKITSETSDLRHPDMADLFLNRDISWWKMTHEDKGSAHHVFNTLRLICPF